MALQFCPRSEAPSLLASAELEQVVSRSTLMDTIDMTLINRSAQVQQIVGNNAAAGNTKEIQRLLTSTGSVSLPSSATHVLLLVIFSEWKCVRACSPDSRPQPGAFANAICDRNRLTTALMRAARHDQVLGM